MLALVLPLFLLHGRGIAEGIVGLIGALFIVRSVIARDWSWLRTPWLWFAAAWWGWLVLGSLPDPGQALAVGRFLLLVAALEHWALRAPGTRVWLLRVVQASALYIAAQSVLQFATGRNLFGFPRGADGELTGPYQNPRAGPPLSRMLFPSVLPPVAAWLARRAWWPLAGAALALASVGVMVLIGQRMPLLLTILGLFVTALLLPRLRGAVLMACVGLGLLLGATSVVSPPTFARLVTKFSTQMAHFPDSHYGQIAARAVAIAGAHPWRGAGFDGFRDECANPAYFRGWATGNDVGEGGGAAICVQHPHNHYLQALVEGGVPGLVLFCAMVLAWLWPLARGLWRDPSPLRVGLFVAALLHEWPLASAAAFTSMPLSGWFFLLLGLGLAESRAYMQTKHS